MEIQAQEGNLESQRKLGKYLVEGKYHITKDISHGLLWLAKAINAGDDKAHYYLFRNKIEKSETDTMQTLSIDELSTIALSMDRASYRYRMGNRNLDCFIDILKISTLSLTPNQKQNLNNFLAARNFGVSENMNEFLKSLITTDDASSVTTIEPVAHAPLEQEQNQL